MHRTGWAWALAALVACDVDGKDRARAGAEAEDQDTAVEDSGIDSGVDSGVDSDTDTGGDSGEDSGEDTADTGAWDPTLTWGTCAALIQPVVMRDGDDLMMAHRWIMPEVSTLEARMNALLLAADPDCPTVTEEFDELGVATTVFQGGCVTSDGLRVDGRATMSEFGSATEWSHVYTFQAFVLDMPGEVASRLMADGRLTLSGTSPPGPAADAGSTFTVEADLHYGIDEGGIRGEWAHRSRLTQNGESGLEVTDAYVRVLDASEPGVPLGDWCESIHVVDAAACLTEGDGTLTATGTGTVTLALDGTLACDGCGMLTADGVAKGSFCPDWGGGTGTP